MIPEHGDRQAFKRVVLSTVIVWTLDCGHQIVAKPDWVDYLEDGVLPCELICPYCKGCDPNLIYMTQKGLARVMARGLEACDIRYASMEQFEDVLPNY